MGGKATTDETKADEPVLDTDASKFGVIESSKDDTGGKKFKMENLAESKFHLTEDEKEAKNKVNTGGQPLVRYVGRQLTRLGQYVLASTSLPLCRRYNQLNLHYNCPRLPIPYTSSGITCLLVFTTLNFYAKITPNKTASH